MPHRVVFAKNPASSRARHGEALIERMKPNLNGLPHREFKTPSKIIWDNIDALAEQIQDGDVVVSVGGDGMTFIACNALMKANRSSTSLAVLPAGGGNDASRTLVKRPRHAPYVVKNGSQRTAYPAHVKLQHNGETTLDFFVMNYFGVGISGDVTHRLNNGLPRRLRNNQGLGSKIVRKTVDVAVAADSLFIGGVTPCIYERNGEAVKVSELMYVNGGSLGGTIYTGQTFEQPDMTRVEIPSGYFGRAGKIGSVAMRAAVGLSMVGETVKDDRVTLLTDQRVQFDGEDLNVQAGSTLEVSITQRSLSVWSTAPTLSLE